jgi:glycine/D-amino acid oxidase-like deaminating enzyme/nitrite reductase/ring-hydroxylating ferredoxin subunit
MSMRESYFTTPPQPYWMASTEKTDYPKLEEDVEVDVAVIGGGITGITCAWLLKREGLKVAVIEADRIVQGTTGHTTAKITSQHGLIYSKIKKQMGMEVAKQYADANEAAIRMIGSIITEHKIDCDFSPQSAYVYTQRDGYVKKIEEEVKTAGELGIKATFIEKTDLPFPVKAAVRFDEQAQFHPRKYLLPLAKQIPGDGSHIFEQSRVVDIDNGSSYILKTSDRKTVRAEKVTIASHYPIYNKAGLYVSKIYPERSYVVAIKAKNPYPGGMYITAEEPGRSLRSQPFEDVELILVGGEHHKTGQGVDTIEHYINLADFAYENFDVEGIYYRWSTQDCMTVDGLPYAGHFASDTPNMYVATGYAKWGMTNSMAAATIIRNLIIGGESPWYDAYNPSRQTLAASLKTLVVENLNVAVNLVKGKLASVPGDVEIKEGEAIVIEIDGDKAGAYRDEKGTLHIVDTTCTHLGCELKWNSAEKSWDCPCHGSRFTYEGEIVEGPTVKPLKTGKEQID